MFFSALMPLGSLCYTLQLSLGTFSKHLSEDEESYFLTLAEKLNLEARNVLVERNLRLVAHIMKNTMLRPMTRRI